MGDFAKIERDHALHEDLLHIPSWEWSCPMPPEAPAGERQERVVEMFGQRVRVRRLYGYGDRVGEQAIGFAFGAGDWLILYTPPVPWGGINLLAAVTPSDACGLPSMQARLWTSEEREVLTLAHAALGDSAAPFTPATKDGA